MQAHTIEWRGNCDGILHIDTQSIYVPDYSHVIFRYRQAKLVSFFEDATAQNCIGRFVVAHGACQLVHVILQFEVANVDRCEQDREEHECRQHQAPSHQTPAWQRGHGS